MSESLFASEAVVERLPRLPNVGRLRYPLGIALLAGLYYGAARVGYELNFAGPVAAIVWLPVGVAISFLYLGGLAYWPGVLIGDLLANDYSALPLGSAIGQTCGNVLEVVVATMIIRTAVPLASIRGVGRMLVGIAAGTALSATVGALSLWPTHVIASGDLATVWRTWWLGDFTGALVVVPFAIAWWRTPPLTLTPRRAVEAGLLLAATIGLSQVAFRSHRPLTYLVFPTLMWAALRFGRRGATLAVAIVVSLALWNTTHYSGPFVFHSVTRSVLSTQLFIAVAALSALCLAVVVSERERFAESLTASRARIIEAGDLERQRIEHNLHDGAQQRLTSLAFRLQNIAALVESPAQARVLVQEAQAQLELAIDELRELAHGIHPAPLRTFGLARSITSLAAASAAPITIVELPSVRLQSGVEATAYYVVAEAITNAQKHARASAIRVRIKVSRDLLLVEVGDDGAGGVVESHGSGLEGLRDRVEATGGTFHVTSAAGRGTKVTAVMPALRAD